MVISKADFITLLKQEAHIVNHLASKVRPEDVDFKPADGMRTTLEWFRYLAMLGQFLVPGIRAGQPDGALGKSLTEKYDAMDFEAVKADLTGLGAWYAEAVGAIPDAEFAEEVEIYGPKQSKGATMIRLILEAHAAYRTQIFVYLKQNGQTGLNTMNLWAGMDGSM